MATEELNWKKYDGAGSASEKDVTQIHDEKHGHYQDREPAVRATPPHTQIPSPIRAGK